MTFFINKKIQCLKNHGHGAMYPSGKNMNYQNLPLGGSIFRHKNVNVNLNFEFFYNEKL
jgi:hypothetical protein